MSIARRTAVLMLAAAAGSAFAGLQPGDDPQSSPVWQKVQASLFEGRPIVPAPAGALVLEVPARAVDGAFVPLAIRARMPDVRRVYLVIDQNPSPVSGIFEFGPASGRAELETRVRIDDYTFVRAIAETADGRLFGTVRFVKASGGCSAPAGGDAAAALATLGQMNFRVEGDARGSAPVLAQLAISHPNHSGLAMDQASRQITPAHYVRKVEVSYRGQPLFSADVDFSMSENPNFRFWFQPQGGGELRATVVDSQDRRFSATQRVGG